MYSRRRRDEVVIPLTSACVKQLCPLDEAQVACPGPQSLGIPEAQFGIEMISLQTLLPVDGVVATGIVRTAHPDLKTNDTEVNFVALERLISKCKI